MNRAVNILAVLAAALAVILGAFYILWPQIILSRRRAYADAAVEHILAGGGGLSIEADFSEPPFIADGVPVLADLPGAGGGSGVLSPAAVLDVPALDMTMPVFFGAGLAELPSTDSSRPSYVLAGVRGAAAGDRFSEIDRLAEGDSIILTPAGGENPLTYMVHDVSVIPADALVPGLSVPHYESWLILAAPSSPISAREYTLVRARLSQ